MKSTVFTFAALVTLSGSSFGAVLTGTSFARDVSATATVTGSLIIPIAVANVAVGPVNSATGVSPAPYSSNPGLGGGAIGNTTLATLDADVAALEILAESDVDGLEGNRDVDGLGVLTTASVGLILDLGGLGVVNVLNVSAGNGTTAFTSDSGVAWNGTSLTPTASTNLLDINNGITISVLNSTVALGALVPNVETTFNVNVNLNLINATGTIRITADGVTTSGLNSLSASASATALRVVADLNVTAAGLANLNVQSTTLINSTSAAATAAAVPEAGSSLLALGGALGLLMRRSRKA